MFIFIYPYVTCTTISIHLLNRTIHIKQNRSEQNRREQNRLEQNRTDQKRTIHTKQNRSEQNRTEQNRTNNNISEQIINSYNIEQLITICNITEHFTMNRSDNFKHERFVSSRLKFQFIMTEKVLILFLYSCF